MFFSSRTIGLLLCLASTAAGARDLPAEMVPTREDLYLKGQPKKVVTQSPTWATEQKFNRDGVLVSQMIGGMAGVDPFEIELKKKRLVEVRYSPSKQSHARASRALQFDGQGRVTAMTDASGSASPTMRMLTPSDTVGQSTTVRIIRYEDGRQVHDIYVNRQLKRSLAYEFSPDGRLLRRSCATGDCAFASETRYGDHGPLSTVDKHLAITYVYENGVLVEEIVTNRGNKEATHTWFGDYAFDACGNWTAKSAYRAPASDTTRQPIDQVRRVIDYFEPCKGG